MDYYNSAALYGGWNPKDKIPAKEAEYLFSMVTTSPAFASLDWDNFAKVLSDQYTVDGMYAQGYTKKQVKEAMKANVARNTASITEWASKVPKAHPEMYYAILRGMISRLTKEGVWRSDDYYKYKRAVKRLRADNRQRLLAASDEARRIMTSPDVPYLGWASHLPNPALYNAAKYHVLTPQQKERLRAQLRAPQTPQSAARAAARERLRKAREAIRVAYYGTAGPVPGAMDVDAAVAAQQNPGTPVMVERPAGF